MLADIDAAANVAVKDLERAKAFYEGVLGLVPAGGQEGHLVSYRSGRTRLNVYVSEYAGSNKATAVTWDVPDVDSLARTLAERGVRFERYEMPGMRLEGDVHVAEGGAMRVAWFKDPDGNILNLFSGSM